MICLYENLPLMMNRKVLDRVAGIYFTDLTGQRPNPPVDATSPAADPFPAPSAPVRNDSMPPLTVNDAELAADMASIRTENWTAF